VTVWRDTFCARYFLGHFIRDGFQQRIYDKFLDCSVILIYTRERKREKEREREKKRERDLIVKIFAKNINANFAAQNYVFITCSTSRTEISCFDITIKLSRIDFGI